MTVCFSGCRYISSTCSSTWLQPLPSPTHSKWSGRGSIFPVSIVHECREPPQWGLPITRWGPWQDPPIRSNYKTELHYTKYIMHVDMTSLILTFNLLIIHVFVFSDPTATTRSQYCSPGFHNQSVWCSSSGPSFFPVSSWHVWPGLTTSWTLQLPGLCLCYGAAARHCNYSGNQSIWTHMHAWPCICTWFKCMYT